jgi:hypothetical protein
VKPAGIQQLGRFYWLGLIADGRVDVTVRAMTRRGVLRKVRREMARLERSESSIEVFRP